jgi:hypothetical protein
MVADKGRERWGYLGGAGKATDLWVWCVEGHQGENGGR